MIFSGYELNIFLVIDNLLFINRLKVYSLIWVLILSVDQLFCVLDRFSDIFQILNSITISNNFNSVFDCFNWRLSYSFLDNGASRSCYRYFSDNSLISNLSISSHLFSINWSFSSALFDNRCLNNSLFDYRLGNYSSCNDRLSNNLLFYQRLLNYLLSLSNKRSGVIDLVSVGYFAFTPLNFDNFICGLIALLINLSATLRLNNFDLTRFN